MKSFLKIIAINLGLVLGVVIIAELIFGNWITGPNYRVLNIPRNVERVFDVTGLYDGAGKITYSRDQFGLRGQYEDVSEIDVLTLGGSTTNQLYVDDQKTWQAQLSQLFRDAGTPVSIVNAGVDGQSTRGHIAIFDRWFPEIDGLKARYILVYAAINDMALNNAEQYDDMSSPDPVRRIKDWLKNKSAIYDMFKTLKGIYVAEQADLVHGSGVPDSDEWVRWQEVGKPMVVPDGWEPKLAGFTKRLGKLAEKIRAFGAKPIFVTQPSAEYQLRDGWLYLPKTDNTDTLSLSASILFKFNRSVLEFCQSGRDICVDIAGSVEFDRADFYDRIHNTDRGAQKIAAFLFESLAPILSRKD